MPLRTGTTLTRRTSRAMRHAALGAVAALTLAACASGAPRWTFLAPSPTDHPTLTAAPVAEATPREHLDIKGFAFVPGTIEVAVGTTIEWINSDLVAHTVTSDAGLFDSGVMQNQQTFAWTFDAAGTFDYHCTIHPTMVATVVVRA